MALDQLSIPGLVPTATPVPRFDGATYEPEADQNRLATQLVYVRELMLSGGWWTIAQLIDAIWKRGAGATQQGVSARIRDLRKPRFGGYVVERRHAPGGAAGLYEYRIQGGCGQP